MPNPSRNEIYQAVLRRMVTDALQAQEDAFAAVHGSDSKEQLADYLRRCAAELGHTPWPKEIVGGYLIRDAFGSWDAALTAAGLPRPTTPDKTSAFLRIQEETERQKQIYREKKAAKKQLSQQRRMAQQKKKKEH